VLWLKVKVFLPCTKGKGHTLSEHLGSTLGEEITFLLRRIPRVYLLLDVGHVAEASCVATAASFRKECIF
jgi:hypothetical protein